MEDPADVKAQAVPADEALAVERPAFSPGEGDLIRSNALEMSSIACMPPGLALVRKSVPLVGR